jgi:hypothetical protein
VLILKRVKVVCFDTLLEVLILKEVELKAAGKPAATKQNASKRAGAAMTSRNTTWPNRTPFYSFVK